MKNFSKVSLGALFIVLMTSPAFAELASKTYVERKTSINEDPINLIGKIAVYASDASGGQKIAAGIAANTLLTTSDLTKIGLNGATATTGIFNFYAPTTLGTNGFILRSNGTDIVWGGDSDHITTATTSGNGNAVTAITADENGALSITKGANFLTTETDPSVDTTVMGTPFTTPGTTGTAGKVYRVQKDAAGKAVVSVPWDTYSAATSTALGLAKLASDTAQSIAPNAVTATANRTYGIQNNASGQLVVNVPWDVYTHPTSGATGSYGPGSNATLTHGGTFTIPSFTVDANGHTTVAATRTMTMPEDAGVATGTTAGSANTYTLAGTGFVLTRGSHVVAKINAANTGAATLNVNSTGAKTIQFEGAALTAGMLKVNTDYSFVYDGTNWQLLSDNNNITTATDSGIGNGVASVTANASGALTVTKANFLTTETDPSVDTTVMGTPFTTPGTTGTAGKVYRVQKDAAGKAVVSVPWDTYSAATSTALGLAKLASDTAQSIAPNAVTATANRTYGIQNNASGQLVVNVPWDVYTHPTSGATGSYGPGSNATLTHGGTFTIPSFTVDANGHTTVAATRTMTMPEDAGVATGTTAGSANTYTLAGTGFVLTRGSHVVAKINAANTGAATLNVNSTGAKTIQFEGAALTAGMLKVNTDYSFVYDGTYWQLLSDNDTIYTHPTITRTDTTSSAALTAGGTVTIVDGVTTNAQGHLTAVNLKTATLPVDTNSRAFNGASTAGTAAAYTLATTQPAFTAADLTDGSIVIATIHATNSANPTLSVGGQTPKPIFMTDTDAAAAAGALKDKGIYSFTFNGSKWYAKDIDTNTAANLSTTSTTALSTSASESLLSGTVNLHKIAKTGTYSDLIGAPAISIPDIPTACKAANTTCSLNYGQCTATENVTGVACSGAQYYWEIVVR